MKKKRSNKPKLLGTFKNPPKGWPSKIELKETKKDLAKKLSTKVLSRNIGPVDHIKVEICAQFIRYLRQEKISQRQLALQLNINESRVSEIVHYHFESYTIDKLLTLLSIIKPNVQLKLGAAS